MKLVALVHPIMKSIVVTFLFLISLSLAAKADGSFVLTEIQDLLGQQPALRDFIADHLETTPGGLARRINTGDNPNLAGTRMAPYRLKAKPKGAPGDFDLMLIIEAETHFLNARGEEVPLSQATRVEERFTGICLLPAE